MHTQCLVISCNATLDMGGETIFATGLATELRTRKGVRSTLLIRNELKGAEVMDLENPTHRLPHIVNPVLIVFNLFLFTVCAIPVALAFIKKARRKKQNIVIHAHDGTFSGVVGTIVGRLSGTPVVITFHGTHILSAYYIFGTLNRIASIVATCLSKFCMENADLIIAIDPKTRSCLESETRTRKDILIVPTFCRELNAQSKTGKELDFPSFPMNSKLIGYV